ncbi:MAG: hypothetical protein GTO63_22865 [Anaerolineae bacterium]|nr:hypothetical protein [Anaerolineae bacterium]
MRKSSLRKALLVALVASIAFLGFSGWAEAGKPTAVPFYFQFTDVNPCTGNDVTVTMIGTLWFHDHDGRSVVRIPRTITTSDGFEGRGTLNEVINGKIEKFTLNDMLTHESGDKFRAHFVLVVDLSTGTVRVLKGGVQICLGP